MANEDIFKAFHNQLLRTGNDNNTFYVYNEDKTAMIIYTEADPSNIKRMILEREGDKYIAINEVEQIREEIENIGIGSYLEVTKETECNDREVRMSKKFATAILDKLIAESEG